MTGYWGYPLAALVFAGLLAILIRYFSLWLRAFVTGTHVSFLSLMLMSLRNINPGMIVKCKIMIAQAGLPEIPVNQLEAQILAGGNVERVIHALIIANRARIKLDWDTAATIDLTGRDILEAVQVTVNPRIIFCPVDVEGYRNTLNGVSRDGIQLNVRVLVTVRTNISQLVGGAMESTVIARVGEGIISAIGSCENYQEVLADPSLITRKVIHSCLDSQTAFSIVSIDIADIDVGENIGARLQINQASADIRIARARAEQRRAMALARTQEMIALTRKNQAIIILAEAEIPKAIAFAFRAGQLYAKEHQNNHVSPNHYSTENFKLLLKAISNENTVSTKGIQRWESEGGSWE